MSEQTDEELFGRMRAVLVARCDQSEYNDTANRGVMIWHRDTGWGAGVLATFWGEVMETDEESVRDHPTAAAALRALAEQVIANGVDD